MIIRNALGYQQSIWNSSVIKIPVDGFKWKKKKSRFTQKFMKTMIQ